MFLDFIQVLSTLLIRNNHFTYYQIFQSNIQTNIVNYPVKGLTRVLVKLTNAIKI